MREWLRGGWNRTLLALCLLGGVASSAFAGGQLTALTLGGDADSPVLELQLSARVRERVFLLQQPDRLVVDLPATRRAPHLKAPAASGVVSAVRLGPQANGTLRVVLQLDSARQIRSQRGDETGAGYTLRVELQPRPQGRPATAATGPDLARASAAPADEPLVPPAPQPVKSVDAVADGKDVIIALDPGHGGQDPGATGANGTHEKDVTLAIARALAARINAQPGMKAVLTRDGDYFIPLRQRMVIARKARADLFVSIHADAVRDRSVTGASVYVVSDRGASSEAARWLAESENAADLKGGVSLSDVNDDLASVLLNLSQSASQGASSEVASEVIKSLDRVGAVRKPEVQYAAFVVIKSPDIPSILVETAYISNPVEERRLRSPDGQAQVADAIFGGIRSYFTAHPPVGSRFAEPVKLARSGR